MKTIATLETIPHSLQRYPTCGDWRINRNGKIEIFVSDMNDPDSEFLVALHELVEAYLCHKAGITDDVVTAFDRAFEAQREPGNTDEAGDDRDAPYRHEHRIATIVEMIVADAAGVNWKRHEENVNAL